MHSNSGLIRWEDATWQQLRELAKADGIVAVPVGAIEQHGPHLPVSTDSVCAEQLLVEAIGVAKLASPVVIVPAMKFGYSEDHLGFPGTISLSAHVLEDVLSEIGTSVLRSGFHRLVFLNGHGGNDRLLYNVVRRIRNSASNPSAIAATTYWKLAVRELSELRKSDLGGMGHACELETSLMLWLQPDRVRMELAKRHVAEPYSVYRGSDILVTGPVVAPDRFADRTESGVMGDPEVASAEQGRQFSAAIAVALAAFLTEFSSWPLVGEVDR